MPTYVPREAMATAASYLGDHWGNGGYLATLPFLFQTVSDDDTTTVVFYGFEAVLADGRRALVAASKYGHAVHAATQADLIDAAARGVNDLATVMRDLAGDDAA
jgi:hypothetical protein